MIVEHDFVTTAPGPTALDRVEAFLRSRGFATTRIQRALRAKGGRRAPSLRRPLTDWPIALAVEEDRGRVTVAADLDTRYGEPDAAAVYLRALARRVEAAVADAASDAGTAVGAEWEAALAAVAEEFRRRRRRRRVLWGVFLAAIAALLGLIVWAATAAS